MRFNFLKFFIKFALDIIYCGDDDMIVNIVVIPDNL
jgi:hypothetical protein